MKFHNKTAEIYLPVPMEEAAALARTTHMGIGAHQDDLEFMALHGILSCFQKSDQWYTGVTVTDGRGSARANEYASYSDEEMMHVRRGEQRKAAYVGEYSAMISLDYPSAAVKDPTQRALIEELKMLISASRPDYIYTHNLADKHETHLGVVIPVIQALRELPLEARPKALYGSEGWRNLDWMLDSEKVTFDVSGRENISNALMGIFDSQISGGKRYDQATYGRKKANATYFSSHSTDKVNLQEFAMDLTPLIHDPSLDIAAYAGAFIERFAQDVAQRLKKRLGK